MLARDNGVRDVCKAMGVSPAGYYKWKKRDKTKHNLKREQMLELIRTTHEDHKTHGYKWTAAFICINTPYRISNNFAYKCFTYLGIHAETEHKPHYKPRKEKDKYPNLIFSTWDTVDRPRQVIVSDMTALKSWLLYVEVTFYFDVFTKEMLTFHVADRRGHRMQYIEGLQDIIAELEGCTEPTILHTDQGSVYASIAYNDLVKDTNIIRSMSRAGKPTDNPVNESLNGWIKEELIIDFHIDKCKSNAEVIAVLEKYKTFYNTQRPCYAINYETPARYNLLFKSGERVSTDTFKDRVLDPTPKFVRDRRKNQITNDIENVSTSENEKQQKVV